MAEIFNISKQDSDRWHAKKAVDKFLDSNKMYSTFRCWYLHDSRVYEYETRCDVESR